MLKKKKENSRSNDKEVNKKKVSLKEEREREGGEIKHFIRKYSILCFLSLSLSHFLSKVEAISRSFSTLFYS